MEDDETTLDTTVAPAVVTPAPIPAVAPVATAVPVVAPAVPAPAPTRTRSSDDDEKARLADHKARGKRAALRELYGTDDEEEVKRIRSAEKAKLAEHDALVAADAERKRSQMSEVEALQA